MGFLESFTPGGIIANIFSGIASKAVDGAVDSYKAKLAAGNTTDTLLADLAGKSQSLVLAHVTAGSYTLTLGADRGTSGAYQLDVFLAGDANFDRQATLDDGTLIRAITGAKSGDPSYRVEADANFDGLISSTAPLK